MKYWHEIQVSNIRKFDWKNCLSGLSPSRAREKLLKMGARYPCTFCEVPRRCRDFRPRPDSGESSARFGRASGLRVLRVSGAAGPAEQKMRARFPSRRHVTATKMAGYRGRERGLKYVAAIRRRVGAARCSTFANEHVVERHFLFKNRRFIEYFPRRSFVKTHAMNDACARGERAGRKFAAAATAPRAGRRRTMFFKFNRIVFKYTSIFYQFFTAEKINFVLVITNLRRSFF